MTTPGGILSGEKQTELEGSFGAMGLSKDLDLFADLDDIEVDFVTLPPSDLLTSKTSKPPEKETNAEVILHSHEGE